MTFLEFLQAQRKLAELKARTWGRFYDLKSAALNKEMSS
jgi:hypothetical protein